MRETTRLKPCRRQSGMSMLLVMVIIMVVAFLGLFASKVGPHYFEFWTISKVVTSAAEDSDLMKKTPSKIYQQIDQSYGMNNIWDMKAKDTIELTKSGSQGYTITVRYEKRANLFQNIDVVTAFEKPIEN